MRFAVDTSPGLPDLPGDDGMPCLHRLPCAEHGVADEEVGVVLYGQSYLYVPRGYAEVARPVLPTMEEMRRARP